MRADQSVINFWSAQIVKMEVREDRRQALKNFAVKYGDAAKEQLRKKVEADWALRQHKSN